ncbi:MAG: LysM peptidoglycan-binding domain-containing protein [Desulfobacteraceae bacterium]
MLITRRSNPTGISVKRETPLIVFGAGILIVIVVLVSFFPMTWNVKDEEYIKELEKRVSDLERKMAENPTLPVKLPNNETNSGQINRLLSDCRRLEASLSMESKVVSGRVDELQKQVDELRRRIPREQQTKETVTPERKRIQPVAEKSLKKNKKKETHYHLVRQGDTFYSISKSYDLSLEKLRELNKFDDKAKLYPGQTIIVGP